MRLSHWHTGAARSWFSSAPSALATALFLCQTELEGRSAPKRGLKNSYLFCSRYVQTSDFSTFLLFCPNNYSCNPLCPLFYSSISVHRKRNIKNIHCLCFAGRTNKNTSKIQTGGNNKAQNVNRCSEFAKFCSVIPQGPRIVLYLREHQTLPNIRTRSAHMLSHS